MWQNSLPIDFDWTKDMKNDCYWEELCMSAWDETNVNSGSGQLGKLQFIITDGKTKCQSWFSSYIWDPVNLIRVFFSTVLHSN